MLGCQLFNRFCKINKRGDEWKVKVIRLYRVFVTLVSLSASSPENREFLKLMASFKRIRSFPSNPCLVHNLPKRPDEVQTTRPAARL